MGFRPEPEGFTRRSDDADRADEYFREAAQLTRKLLGGAADEPRPASSTSEKTDCSAFEYRTVTRHALLNNVDHRDLRVITTRGAAYGDDVMCALTFPAEFRNVQAHYPIVFAKARDGTFTPLALFGFREKQNLFLTPDGWDALYVPMMIERQPFLIGSSGTGKVVHIDLDSPRVSRTTGELLFLEHGGNYRVPGAHGLDARRDRRGHRGDTALHRRAAGAQPARVLRARHRVPRRRAASLRRLLRHAGGAPRRSSAPRRSASCTSRATCRPSTWSSHRSSNFRGLIERASKLDAADR